ncbi:DUF2141 domain-containing protein [Mesonia sp. HuA40]|uniref:DUF2141 domain-containing protein n=1 Tax=Mesonia sp. HuA40 TaxID=2602761 RepID=UPI0011C71D0B|nr:DUF2141 domain-containing protein [Mesonia sp. HuA40]TXK74045.1 DUF2141 domain-containing protein [Mesonia sp. HuA40]
MKYLFLFLIVLSLNTYAQNEQLVLSIDNITKIKGTIEVGVFNKSDGFLEKNTAIKNYSIPVNNHTLIYTIKDLPEGDYAISMYQDINEDKKCNLNFIGVPKEPYAFSNNVKPKFSAPNFEECKFRLEKKTKLSISLLE